MAGKTKNLMQKFDRIDAGRIKGKKAHTRTGACTCPATQKCYHGSNNPHKQGRKGK